MSDRFRDGIREVAENLEDIPDDVLEEEMRRRAAVVQDLRYEAELCRNAYYNKEWPLRYWWYAAQLLPLIIIFLVFYIAPDKVSGHKDFYTLMTIGIMVLWGVICGNRLRKIEKNFRFLYPKEAEAIDAGEGQD